MAKCAHGWQLRFSKIVAFTFDDWCNRSNQRWHWWTTCGQSNCWRKLHSTISQVKGHMSRSTNTSRRVTLFEWNGPMMPFSKAMSALFVPFAQIIHMFQRKDKLSTLPFTVHASSHYQILISVYIFGNKFGVL